MYCVPSLQSLLRTVPARSVFSSFPRYESLFLEAISMEMAFDYP